jgi:D-alanyl-D-alanine carboxypeptidase (penicillin-binding protein 5/6)
VLLAGCLLLASALAPVRALAPAAAPKFPGPPPRAWALVDGDTGRVIASGGARVGLPPASLSKVFTALAVVSTLRPDAAVVVSKRAAGAPASRLGLRAGQTWRAEDLLRAMLLVSANDAALALAEKVGGGDLGAFQSRVAALSGRLGLADRPVLRDPAGLDDGGSVGGGNRVSARDLAIVARAALAQPRIAGVVRLKDLSVKGPDGVKRRLVNHNKLLSTYRGLVGIKTGYTVKAGGCLLTAARRDGRTMIAVVLGVKDIYGSSKALLDLGFSMRAKDEPRADPLPRVVDVTAKPAAARPAPPRAPARPATARPARPAPPKAPPRRTPAKAPPRPKAPARPAARPAAGPAAAAPAGAATSSSRGTGRYQ